MIRSSVSSSSATAQNIFLKALDSPGYEAQKKRYRALLEGRYREAKKAISERPLPASLKALPFNSGYFMSFECLGISAETLRVKLLDGKGIGTISMQDRYLRVAFSSVEELGIAELYREIAAAAAELAAL